MNITDRLLNEANKKSPICVGLDTKEEYIPDFIMKMDIPLGEKVYLFNKYIIDATNELAACFKVQIAFYEQMGLEGLQAYSKTLKYIKGKGAISIADVKRGDISSTASAYAKAHFEGDFEADYITVNGYMGIDAVSPYFEYIKNNEKGLFVLVKTSNPSSGELQDLKLESEDAVYLKMAELVCSWGEDFIGKSGFSAIGAVAGLTYPKEFKQLKEKMPNTFYLIPGYGAQGGTGKDIAQIFDKGICGVVNSSRGIIAAAKGKDETEGFINYIVEAAEKMKEDILQWL